MGNPNATNLAAGAIPIYDTGGVIASDGVLVPVDSLAQTMGYDGSNNLTTVTVTYLGNVYVQTLTYTGSNLTGVSRFIKQ